MPFTFEPADRLEEVIVITPRKFPDSRGGFFETYRESSFAQAGIACGFVQDNVSLSVKGVIRGLHYQKNPDAQAKLVRVIRGEIFDVAVDIRKGSPTFGVWTGITLSEGNMKMVYVPEGFAHGFAALSNEAEVLYKVSREYAPKSEAGILWNDPEIGIKWPVKKPLLSDKDTLLPELHAADNNFSF